ncbi:MAG: branched-chain amino acid ABC transporter permease [Spirochaetia bacterium]|nr:branched-chain amino acid ABC transporter permease [Spirochaetia bacterium]MCF7952565.1 branched-chain amino acid ABC transporter permease [Spirochaetales bacterium]
MQKINWLEELKKSTLSALWFIFLTFPIMVMKVSTMGETPETFYRWGNLVYVGIGTFFLSFVWRYMHARKEFAAKKKSTEVGIIRSTLGKPKVKKPSLTALIVFLVAFPFIFSMYQTNIMISVLIYIILGLGLNIVIGYGGLLHLGYAAFYAVGAYTYALFFHFAQDWFYSLGLQTGLMFWIAIPAAVLLSLVFGALICLPVIRLRGDYLAIVTLAFGEITRMVLQNWGDVTQGPSGISQIPRPWFFGMRVDPIFASKYIYLIALAMVIISIILIKNLENSKIGRAWEAMREDEIACQSMGVSLARSKLYSFALGAMWAGFAGVLLAAKTTFINPASFTLWESVMILCIVVLGGMGSIPGVLVGASLMMLLPEYFRAFSEYRMLIFGLVLVLMMIFKPEGIVPRVRNKYTFEEEDL